MLAVNSQDVCRCVGFRPSSLSLLWREEIGLWPACQGDDDADDNDEEGYDDDEDGNDADDDENWLL